MDGNDREITGFQGWLEMQVGDFRAAELQFRDVLSSLVKADYESAEGRDQLADTLVAIGVAVERDGRDGAGFFKRALELRPSLIEESKRASTLEHLARALRTRGSSDENEAHLYETMAMRIRSRRVAHITTNEGSCQSCALDPKDEDVPMPKVLDITPPAYSYEAITSAVRGESRFCVDVRSSGEVSSVCLLRSAGFGLDENAAWAIARWRFEAQPSKGIVRIRYDLTD
jgi:TonB family protein